MKLLLAACLLAFSLQSFALNNDTGVPNTGITGGVYSPEKRTDGCENTHDKTAKALCKKNALARKKLDEEAQREAKRAEREAKKLSKCHPPKECSGKPSNPQAQ